MILGDLSVSLPSSPLAPADSNLVQPEFWALPRVGSPFVIHEVGDFDIAGIAGSRGAISLEVPANTVMHRLLESYTVGADSDLEIEIRLFGGQPRSLRGFLHASEADEVAEGGTARFSGALMAQRLYEIRLDPNPADEKGEWHFAAKNAGQIVATLMQLAAARGTGTDITTATFNTSLDSKQAAWTTNTTIVLSPGSLYGELLEEFENLGLCEWEVTGFRELKLYNPGTRGTDRTVGAGGTPGAGFGTSPFGTTPFGGTPAVGGTPVVVLHRGRDLVDAGRTHNVRDSVTNLLVAGKEGLYATANDPSAQARRGRRIEGYASAGQIENAAALTGFAQNKLATLASGALELSHGLVVNGVGPLPFLDVNEGDWVYSSTGRTSSGTRVRVQQVTISRRGGVLSAAAVVGTLSQSAIVALNRRLARLERGTTVVGTTEADPGVGGEDTTAPSAPTGLVASSIAYQDTPTGETLAMISLGWDAVTTDARPEVSALARAAQSILDRIQSGAGILEDWTWAGMPALVTTHHDTLLDAFIVYDGDYDFPADLDRAETWLQDYITTAEAAVPDPTVTDDISGYRVRYAYVGIGQIGGLPSSDPFEGDVLAFYEPQGSPTTATSLTFGGVGAGRDVRLQVAAFDRSGNQSVWSNPFTFTTAVDNTPPPATSAPVLSTWFRTLDIYWDGLTVDGISMLEAAPDFDHVAVILAQSASIPVPSAAELRGDPLPFDPLVTGPQWIHNMYGSGTFNVANLQIGVGWYAILVAVDRAGNPSGTSETAGPATAQRLVTIDIGPDAIGREQIIDLEVIRGKIDNLAVNSAKVEELDVGLLRTGTMTAIVTNSGLFRTATTGNRVEFDSAGLRLFQGSTVVGNWKTTDASMLMTGVFQTALTGERLMMFTDGTLRFYPVAGTNYSQISNFGNDVVWRGPLDASGRSGRFNVNALGCGMNFSSEAEIPNNLRAEIAVFDRRTRMTAPLLHFQLNGKLAVVDGSPRRAMFSQTNASGVDIGPSFIAYRTDSNGYGGFGGNGGGWKLQAGQVLITTEDLNSFSSVRATDFVTASSREVKTDIHNLGTTLGMRAIELARLLRPVSFRYRSGFSADQRIRLGLVVEEVEPHAPHLVDGRERVASERALSPMGVATVALGAAADNADDIDALRERIKNLEDRLSAA